LIIYVASQANHIYAVSPDGTLKWKYPSSSIDQPSSPVIGNDQTLLVVSYVKMGFMLSDPENISFLLKELETECRPQLNSPGRPKSDTLKCFWIGDRVMLGKKFVR